MAISLTTLDYQTKPTDISVVAFGAMWRQQAVALCQAG